MKAFNLIGSIAIAGLVCAEILPISTSARALERQDLQAAGSYRCADSHGKNVIRVRLTEKNGVASNLITDLGNGNVENLEVNDSSQEGGGQAYTAYSGNSNETIKFIEYPNGKGRYIFSLEKPNGQQQVETDRKCYKVG